jgi:CRISPR-associated protein Csm4
MKIYQVILEPQSPFSSPIQSDTLFGAFCWSWKRLHGEDSLLELLGEYMKGSPPVLFSNLFPYGFLPMPMKKMSYLNMEARVGSREQRLAKYQRLKKLKKQKYVTLENFNRFVVGENTLGEEDNGLVTVISYGNQVNRKLGTVGADDDGGVFTREEYYFTHQSLMGNEKTTKVWFLLKVNSEYERKIQPVIELMCVLGIGGHKSIGRGLSKLVECSAFNGIEVPEKPQAFVTLSNFIPDVKDPVDGYYQILLKYGKTDREFAASEKPFKKALVMLTEGSVFKTKNVKPYYGRMIHNVSALDENIIHYGLAFPVPIRLHP